MPAQASSKIRIAAVAEQRPRAIGAPGSRRRGPIDDKHHRGLAMVDDFALVAAERCRRRSAASTVTTSRVFQPL